VTWQRLQIDKTVRADPVNEAAALVDLGKLRATAAQSYGTITAANLRRAHAVLEAGRAVGKIVLAGF